MNHILPAPFATSNFLLPINRKPEHQYRYPELKDPSVVQIADGSYMMYASIGNSHIQQWIIGRFVAQNPEGPWQEVSPVTFHDLSGPQLCAPAVRFEIKNGQPHWIMYVQTSCFEHEGIIALATSTDGEHFYGTNQPLINRQMMSSYTDALVGLYDAGISEVRVNDQTLLCLLFSGYRRIGCGDLYMTYRSKESNEDDWAPSQKILSQEEVPFHNNPLDQDFEWGLEGAQIIQLADDSFMLLGVCFMPIPGPAVGTRQRVFFAHATSLLGPWIPLTTPFEPQDYAGFRGENGHPDAFKIGDELWIIYQERCANGYPWHFRAATFNIEQLKTYFKQATTIQMDTPAEISAPEPTPVTLTL
jgi:hypothetical protein